jgi:hypothetical protein
MGCWPPLPQTNADRIAETQFQLSFSIPAV